MTTTALDAPQPQLRSWPQDALRIGFGLIWLVDAVLKWLPGFRSTYVSAVSYGAYGSLTGTGNVGYGGYFTNTSTTGANWGLSGEVVSTGFGL